MRGLLNRITRTVLPATALERLGARAEEVARRRFRPYLARHQFGARPYQVWIADPTSRAWYDGDRELPGEFRFLADRGQLRPGARVFDLGAHQGVIALMLAELVTPGGSVIAVEASPANAEAARRNVQLNEARTVRVINAAVADRIGQIAFAPRSNGHVAARSAGAVVHVDTVTVDSLSAQHGPPHVVCIDVEGYELHALRGAHDTLARHRPDLFVEVHAGCGLEQFGGSVREVVSAIPDGYDLYVAPKTEGAWGDIALRPFADLPELPTDIFLVVALARGAHGTLLSSVAET